MRKSLAIIGIVALAATACTSTGPTPAPQIIRPVWRSVTLPTDPRGRDEVRAVAACSGRWFVAGAILVASDGKAAPAMWESTDGVSFTAMTVKPVSYYGPTNVLFSVACHNNTVVAVGADSGGAHGNPRTSTWISTGGGPLTEVTSGLGLYGGEDAIGLAGISGGDGGFLIVGDRLDASGGAGAAVWTSPDGVVFTLHDAVPALESDPRGVVEAQAATPIANGFIAVGGIWPPDSPLAARDPLAWTSPDGQTWQRQSFPHTTGDDLLLSVGEVGAGSLAVGTDASGFEAWAADAAGMGWHRTARFGSLSKDATTVAQVPSLVAIGSKAYAVVSNPSQFQMWRGGSGGSWTQVELPETVSATPLAAGPRVVRAAAAGTDLMVAADDGTSAHVWFTTG
jgi:hypothetical protein